MQKSHLNKSLKNGKSQTMTSKIEDFFDLVPEYFQGTLDPELEKNFEQEMEKNEDLQLEVQEYSQMRELFAESEVEVTPSDAIFNRICDSIEKEESKQRVGQAVQQKTTKASPITIALEWLKESFTLPWSLALVQAAVIVLLLIPNHSSKNYSTLSVANKQTTTAAITSYNVVFKDSAREGEIRALLISIDATISSGPSVQGKYAITIPANKASEDIFEKMKKSQLILFVEKAY